MNIELFALLWTRFSNNSLSLKIFCFSLRISKGFGNHVNSREKLKFFHECIRNIKRFSSLDLPEEYFWQNISIEEWIGRIVGFFVHLDFFAFLKKTQSYFNVLFSNFKIFAQTSLFVWNTYLIVNNFCSATSYFFSYGKSRF